MLVILACLVWAYAATCHASAFKLDFNVSQGFPRSHKVFPKRHDFGIDITNSYYIYTADLYIGSSSEHVKVQIDTGSSDTWVVSSQSTCSSCVSGGTFDPANSTTYLSLGQSFVIQYADGSSASGDFGLDNIKIGLSGPTVQYVQFATALSDTAGWGVLGLGKQDTEMSPTQYTNFLGLLKQQGFISKLAFSVYLGDIGATSGSIIFGGYDTRKYSGKLQTLNITGTEASVLLDGITIGGQSTSSGGASVILDTGTSFSSVPRPLFNAIVQALNAQQSSSGVGYTAPCSQPNEYIGFNFGGVTIQVPYDGLLSYQYQNGHKLSTCSLDLSVGGILGDNFLRYAYVVFDFEDNTISIAPVKYTVMSNIVEFN